MIWIAWKMLTGNRGKYLGIILGIAFASLLIAQQSVDLLRPDAADDQPDRDIEGADIWVMDRNVQFIDDIKPMSENDLYRVRGVAGRAMGRAALQGNQRGPGWPTATSSKSFCSASTTPQWSARRARSSSATWPTCAGPMRVIMDEAGYQLLWPNEPYELGKTFEMNDRRAVLVGVCKASAHVSDVSDRLHPLQPGRAFVPRERKVLSFVLAQPEPGLDPQEVVPADYRADRAAGADPRGVLLEDDLVLPAQDRHSDQLRHHRAARLHRRDGDRGTDVLPVHGREPEAVRHAEGDGRRQPAD